MIAGSGTIVVQSFRTEDVPDWIVRCMTTVRTWAKLSGFEYKMIGDEFLDLAPGWYRQKAGPYLTIVTDLARLVLARQCVENGFDRAIWIDADIIIFSPSRLKIDLGLPFAYCREIWIKKDRSGSLIATQKINNSACLFSSGTISRVHLEKYIAACESTVAAMTKLRDHTEVGTKLLTSWDRERALPVLRGFGLLSPTILQALLHSDTTVLLQFIKLQDYPIYAANLCNFFRTGKKDGAGITDDIYSRVVDKLAGKEGHLLSASATPE